MRGFLPVLKKEAVQMIRDRGTLRFALLIPAFQLVLFGLIDTNVLTVAGEKLGDLLQRYSRRFPELDGALWDATRTALGEHIEVLVNDAVLGVSHDLDTPLEGGERITLLGQFMGG